MMYMGMLSVDIVKRNKKMNTIMCRVATCQSELSFLMLSKDLPAHLRLPHPAHIRGMRQAWNAGCINKCLILWLLCNEQSPKQMFPCHHVKLNDAATFYHSV